MGSMCSQAGEGSCSLWEGSTTIGLGCKAFGEDASLAIAVSFKPLLIHFRENIQHVALAELQVPWSLCRVSVLSQHPVEDGSA